MDRNKEPTDDPTYMEMVRQAALVAKAVAGLADHRPRRDDLIRQLRREGWTLRDIARGAGISHVAVANICEEPSD